MQRKMSFLSDIVLFLFLAFYASAQQEPSMAKYGCKPYCGDVEIPYPFGIGTNCSINDWYEIFCDKNEGSIPPKPFLKRTHLEVLEISVHGTIKVSNHVTYLRGCVYGETDPFVALVGSPFVFSKTTNRFVAVSCGNLVLMNQDSAIAGGCMSVCSTINSQFIKAPCNGIDCCQTELPDDLVVFNVTSLNVSASVLSCEFAFMVDQEWYDNNVKDLLSIPNLEQVPVKLDWRLYNYTVHELGMSELEKKGLSFHCTALSNYRSKWLQCFCETGYKGNPYLLPGCQDINECLDHSRCYGYECVNIPGSYICRQPQGVKVIFIAIFAGFVGWLFLLGGIWRLYEIIMKRKEIRLKRKFFKRNGGLLLQQQLSRGEVNVDKIKMFSSNELEKATNHFSLDRMLGQGGQGTVYKGMLADGRIVAVKKSKVVDEGKAGHFINEVIILSQINHRNVVKLLGCCLETEVPLLVYEFIPNGTLLDYLHNRNREFSLTWDRRLRIATEVAGALSYLHSAASLPIYHRDIKSTNILLDDKNRAKVADFGTSRSISIDQTHLTTLVQGTFGYFDPEYFQSSRYTDKSDVYSFGVVLVELLTGQKPVSSTRIREGMGLAAYFILSIEQSQLFDIIDTRIMKEDTKEDIMAVAMLAKWCLNVHGRNRPTMKEAAAELEGIIQKSREGLSVSQRYRDIEIEFERSDNDLIEAWEASASTSGLDSDMTSPFGIEVEYTTGNSIC